VAILVRRVMVDLSVREHEDLKRKARGNNRSLSSELRHRAGLSTPA